MLKCCWNVFWTDYRTRAIISRGLYFFYPIFTLAAAYIADNLCTKNGNSSLFKLKIRGFKSRAAYDGARTVVTYIDGNFRSPLGYIPILIDTFSSLFIQKSAISHKTLHHGDIFSWSLWLMRKHEWRISLLLLVVDILWVHLGKLGLKVRNVLRK